MSHRLMKIRPAVLVLSLFVGLLLALGGAFEAAGQTQKPPPRPKAEEEPQMPTARPKHRNTGPAAPPPPKLLISSDMSCTVEMDGAPLGHLDKDIVQEFRVKAGDHLLQAFPDGIDGPVWKQTLKAPETGSVVATIELREIVDDWEEEMENVDRFRVDDSAVTDKETGLVWMRNVSPAMKWESIVAYCAGKKDNLGSDADGNPARWRLPSLDELSKLFHPDHPSPRQETDRGDAQWTLLGKRKGEMTVQPRLIHEPFDHNSVSALWVQDQEPRTSCSFLGEFTCAIERKKAENSTLCVRAADR